MRSLVVWLGLAGVMSAQSITEYGAAAVGGATGGAAGKKVSDGITAIFGKVDKQTADAAKQGKPDAAAKTARLRETQAQFTIDRERPLQMPSHGCPIADHRPRSTRRWKAI